ncbi:prolactin-releasing peptide receptor-like [Bacillus rossius redtenbacheri]|uniref:prolactin-releasing peptide receptor-like n=1 Tax=Bacillus rossius redtenbacheri TaxID=93214 RepID=UPI002FDE1B65
MRTTSAGGPRGDVAAMGAANVSALVDDSTTAQTSPSEGNSSTAAVEPGYNIIQDQAVQAVFCVLYTAIFVLGVFGNVLVCYVVCRNRAMHTVTNLFITNLALSDILLCALAVPFTPLYSFLGQWVFGPELCHLVACAQGTSVYISTLTLTSIAVDRFFVIIYPFQQRMQLSTCLAVICGIWLFSLAMTLPYGVYIQHKRIDGRPYCEETWPSENFRQVYGSLTSAMQFLVPFLVIAFCYVRVSLKLNDRARAKPGAKSSRKEEADRERKRRTNRMLIAMVAIFGVSWLPLNAVNVLNDMFITVGAWKYYNLCFFMVHAVAMSSTCYNPFLYAWLNENFRKEFKQVLPCFGASGGGSAVAAGAGRAGGGGRRSERTCNGNETLQETLLHTSVAPETRVPEEEEEGVAVRVETVAFSAADESVQLRLGPEDGRTSPPARLLADGK